MADTPTVQLVDDRDLFRDALRGLLEREGIQVACETADPATASSDLAEHKADVVIVDAKLRSGDGVPVIRDLALHHPRARILVLTQTGDPQLVMESFRAGAHGLVLKDDDVTMLAAAIRSVRAGDGYLSPRVAGTVVSILRTNEIPDSSATQHLSTREIQVLALLTLGMNNEQIAGELEISAKTAKNHVSNILAKLGLDNRVQAAVYAVRNGIS